MENTLSGFEAVVQEAFGDSGRIQDNVSTYHPPVSDDDLSKLLANSVDLSVDKVFGKENSEDTVVVDVEKNEETFVEDKETHTEEQVPPTQTPPTVEDEGEGVAVKHFFNALAEEIGWNVSEEDTVPSTVEDLVSYFKDTITENSTPVYASEDVQRIDEFVKNGGQLQDYMKLLADTNYKDMDLTVESNQEKVVRDLLTEKGFSKTMIDSKIQKYKDVDILEDEAVEAAELLEGLRTEKQEAMVAMQKEANEKATQQQQAFLDNIVSEIKNLNNIRGIKIPESEKQELLKYMFKLDTDGKSQYQKDYSTNIRNIVESAYFTKNRDRLIDDAKREGNNTAMSNLKKSLRSTGAARGGKAIVSTTNNSDIFSRLARELIG